MSTQLWVVQERLQQLLTAAVPAKTIVYRGPRTRSNVPKRFVLIGTDGGEFGLGANDDGMSAEQAPSASGPGTWRDESGEIVCAAWGWSGDDLETVRTDVQALFAGCEGAIYADRSLGGLLPSTGRAEVTGFGIRETQTDKGPVVRVVFTVSYGALITT